MHNQYVRSYIATGQAKILGSMNEFVAVHRDRYVVPVRLQISHVSGIGEDRWDPWDQPCDSDFTDLVMQMHATQNVSGCLLLQRVHGRHASSAPEGGCCHSVGAQLRSHRGL
jgi:hypothetical protein